MKKEISFEERLLSLDIPSELIPYVPVSIPEDFIEMESHFMKKHAGQSSASETDIACYLAMSVLELRNFNPLLAHEFSLAAYELSHFPASPLHVTATYNMGTISVVVSQDDREKYVDELLSLSECSDDRGEQGKILLMAGRVLMLDDKKRRARRLFENALYSFIDKNDTEGIQTVISELIDYSRSVKNKDLEIKMLVMLAGHMHDTGKYDREREIYFELGEMMENAEYDDDAIEHYLFSRKAAEAAGDKAGVARADTRIAGIRLSKGDYFGSRQLFLEAIPTLDECKENDLCVRTHRNVAQTYFYEYDIENAAAHYELALALGREMGSCDDLIFALIETARFYERIADADHAIACYGEMADICTSRDDKAAAAEILTHMSGICKRTKDRNMTAEIMKKKKGIIGTGPKKLTKSYMTSNITHLLKIAKKMSKI